jgi:hypothetical protein
MVLQVVMELQDLTDLQVQVVDQEPLVHQVRTEQMGHQVQTEQMVQVELQVLVQTVQTEQAEPQV